MKIPYLEKPVSFGFKQVFPEVEILFGKYQVKLKAGFSTSQNIGAGGILEQQGFFDQFVISFDHKNKFLEIKKHSLIQDLASKIIP